MQLLFPCDGTGKRPDILFEKEYNAAKTIGFACFLFNHDHFVRHHTLAYPIHSKATTLLLRSWMLNHQQYQLLENILKEKGVHLHTNTANYIACHEFPNYAQHIQNHTPKYQILDAWDAEKLQAVSDYFNSSFILKDYVKSEKSYPDLFIMPKHITGSELLIRVEKFIKLRSNLFNKGLVFKQFTPLKNYEHNHKNEWRSFWYKGQLVSLAQNSNLQQTYSAKQRDEFLEQLQKSILPNISSSFFTIDIAEQETGQWMIIEMGDGQVSGLSPNQNELLFYQNLLQQIE